MRILAIDSSVGTMSVALFETQTVLAECAVSDDHRRSELVLSAVASVLADAGLRLAEIDLFAAGIGPGSFAGVRTALSTTKGFRLATGKRTVGVDSLHAQAASAHGVHRFVVTAIDARRGEVFGALRDTIAHRWVVAPMVGPPESLGEALRAACGHAPLAAIGDLAAGDWDRIQLAYDRDAPFTHVAPRAPLARWVALEALAGRGVEDTDFLEPCYVRPPDAKLPQSARLP